MSTTSKNEGRSPLKVSPLAGTLVILAAIGVLYLVFGKVFREDHMPSLMKIKCQEHLKELGDLLVVYADEHDGRYPPHQGWCDELMARYGQTEDVDHVLLCQGDATGPCSFALNPHADANSAADVVLLFESQPGWNQSGGPELVTTANHQKQGASVYFVDGRVKFVPAEELPALKWQGRRGSAPDARNVRWPANDAKLKYWLENMIWYHRFSTEEVRAATGLAEAETRAAQRQFGIWPSTRPARPDDAPLLVLPYPGGRHPRIGFLEGAVDPQRETKFSVFTPWDPNSYVVVDVPEAIWSNLGLTYLAHTHIDTIWTTRGIELEKLEWTRRPNGELEIARTLPNGIAFGVKVRPAREAVHMEMRLKNGTEQTLSNLNVQNCVMTKMAAGFAELTNDNKVFTDPYVACRDEEGKRWIITAWEGCARPWGNEDCPCFHSDPKFPDLEPGQEHVLRGWLSFYEGDDIEAEFARIEATGWRS